MDDAQDILRKIISDGRRARDKFSSLIARTETAVLSGDWSALADIVKEASKSDGDGDSAASSESGESSDSKVEA